jgi:hypothetical protein
VSFGIRSPSIRKSFPRKRESTLQIFGNTLSTDWIPALRQAQGKLFAGMTVASSAHVSQMTPVPGAGDAAPLFHVEHANLQSIRNRITPFLLNKSPGL